MWGGGGDDEGGWGVGEVKKCNVRKDRKRGKTKTVIARIKYWSFSKV